LLQEKNAPTRTDQFERVHQIFDFFEKLIVQYQIDCVSMEQLFFTKFNQSNAEFVYAIRGALMVLFLRHHIPVQEYTPIELKKYLTGNGKADKMLVQKMVMRCFNLSDLPQFNDAADALGLAYLAKRNYQAY
jgi:crossover junction endodeoxyribonuclease RuvC